MHDEPCILKIFLWLKSEEWLDGDRPEVRDSKLEANEVGNQGRLNMA